MSVREVFEPSDELEAEDLICMTLMPSLWDRDVIAWCILHGITHDAVSRVVEELDDPELVGALVEAVCAP